MVESRFTGLQFDIQGIVPVAYAVFAYAVGLATGVILRRTLPAMATTVGVFVGVRLLVELAFRPSYMSPVMQYASFKAGHDIPSGSLGISSDLILNGHVVAGNVIPIPQACAPEATPKAMSTCLQAQGYQTRETFQPADRWWPFQWIESGIFVGMAAVLIVIAVIWLRRRDA